MATGFRLAKHLTKYQSWSILYLEHLSPHTHSNVQSSPPPPLRVRRVRLRVRSCSLAHALLLRFLVAISRDSPTNSLLRNHLPHETLHKHLCRREAEIPPA